jgi:hypothetical protein
LNKTNFNLSRPQFFTAHFWPTFRPQFFSESWPHIFQQRLKKWLGLAWVEYLVVPLYVCQSIFRGTVNQANFGGRALKS